MAERRIDEDYYNEWRVRQQNAAVSLNDREDKLGAIYDEIECELELVGVTAIEDKLQDGVQHAISNLQMAGIKIWVLTGDKEGKFPCHPFDATDIYIDACQKIWDVLDYYGY